MIPDRISFICDITGQAPEEFLEEYILAMPSHIVKATFIDALAVLYEGGQREFTNNVLFTMTSLLAEQYPEEVARLRERSDEVLENFVKGTFDNADYFPWDKDTE